VACDKKAQRLGAHLACLDESGFLIMPTRRRTWAPGGHTPIISYNYKHDWISILAALALPPKSHHMGLYLRFQPKNFQAVDVADFLRALLRQLRGHVMLLWNQGSMHIGPTIEAVCQTYPWLHIEEWPGYAPELNPTEQVWNNFKGLIANSLLWDTRDLGRPMSAGSGAPRPNCNHSSWHPSFRRHRDFVPITFAKFNNGARTMSIQEARSAYVANAANK
jgi:hypothetical protein